MITYTRTLLLSVQKTVSQQWLRVPLQVLETLRSNKICSVLKTHRGLSARKLGQSTTQPVITTDTPTHVRAGDRGVNWGNITSVSTHKSTSVYGSGLTVGCLNARSLRHKSDIIRDIVIEHDIDILAFTETWLTPNDSDEFHIKGLTLPVMNFTMFQEKRVGVEGLVFCTRPASKS